MSRHFDKFHAQSSHLQDVLLDMCSASKAVKGRTLVQSVTVFRLLPEFEPRLSM